MNLRNLTIRKQAQKEFKQALNSKKFGEINQIVFEQLVRKNFNQYTIKRVKHK